MGLWQPLSHRSDDFQRKRVLEWSMFICLVLSLGLTWSTGRSTYDTESVCRVILTVHKAICDGFTAEKLSLFCGVSSLPFHTVSCASWIQMDPRQYFGLPLFRATCRAVPGKWLIFVSQRKLECSISRRVRLWRIQHAFKNYSSGISVRCDHSLELRELDWLLVPVYCDV